MLIDSSLRIMKDERLQVSTYRHVAVICEKVMQATADLVTSRLWMLAKAATEVH
jgi:hypothetical protein